MEPNCLICNKIEVPACPADLTTSGTKKKNCSKNVDDISRSMAQIKLQIDQTKSVQVLFKLLYIQPTTFLQDLLQDSVICSSCNDRFLSVHQAFSELEVLQGKIDQVRRVIEHDLAASLQEQQETSPLAQGITGKSSTSEKPLGLGLTRDVRKYICDLIQPKTINTCGKLPGVGLDKFIHTNNNLICSLDEIDLDPLFGFRMDFPVMQSQLQDNDGFNSETESQINFNTDTNTTSYGEIDNFNANVNRNMIKNGIKFVEKVGQENKHGYSPGPKSKRKRYNSSQNESEMTNNENIHQPIKYENEKSNKKQIVQEDSRISSDLDTSITSIASSSSSSSSASSVINKIEMKMEPVLVLQKINIDPNKKHIINISKDSKIKNFINNEKIYMEKRKKQVFLKKKYITCFICNKNILRKRFTQHNLIHNKSLEEKKEKCDKSIQLKQNPKPKKRSATAEPQNNDGTNAKSNHETTKTKDQELSKNGVPRLKYHDVGKINRHFNKKTKYK